MNIEEAKRYAEAIRTINRYEISTPMKDSDRLLQIEGGEPQITCEISPTLLKSCLLPVSSKSPCFTLRTTYARP